MTAEGRLSAKERKYRSSINEDLWLINKPYKYKNNWLIWPNTILNKMERSDCNDTIDGVCLDNQSLDECIDRCTGDCGAGVYFKFHDGKSICVPIRTALWANLNPIYHLRRQDDKNPKLKYYDIKDVDVSVFVNTDKFPNPPDEGNAVFYFDIISLKTSDKYISTKYIQGTSHTLNITKDLTNNIQIIPQIITAGANEDNIPLKYGDKFNITIPGTNITASNINNKLAWTVIPVDLSELTYMSFTFNPPIGKKTGDVVTYDNPLVLTYNSSGGSKFVNVKNDDIVIENDIKSKFNIISKMVGNYCDKGKCLQVPIKHITQSGKTGGKYKDSSGNWTPVYRQKGCWNLCNDGINDGINDGSKKFSYWYLIIIGLVIALVITLVIIWIFITKSRLKV